MVSLILMPIEERLNGSFRRVLRRSLIDAIAYPNYSGFIIAISWGLFFMVIKP